MRFGDLNRLICIAGVLAVTPSASSALLGNNGAPQSRAGQTPAKDASNAKDARDTAEQYLKVHSAQCDGFVVVRWGPQELPGLLADPVIRMTASEITTADRLNGVEWSGQFTIETSAERRCQNGRGNACEQWSQWVDTKPRPGRIEQPSVVFIAKTHGRWLMQLGRPMLGGSLYGSGADISQFLTPVAVTCADAPVSEATINRALDDYTANSKTPLTASIDAEPNDRAKRILKGNVTREDLESAFHLAATLGLTDLLDLILRKGVDVNNRNSSGQTALHQRSNADGDRHSIKAAAWLIANGVDVNAQDVSGQTALFDGVFSNDVAFVTLLLANGADPNIRHRDGYATLSIAKGNKNAQLVSLLEHYGAMDSAAALGSANSTMRAASPAGSGGADADSVISRASLAEQNSSDFQVQKRMISVGIETLWLRTIELLARNREKVLVADKATGLIATELKERGFFKLYFKHFIVLEKVSEASTNVSLKVVVHAKDYEKLGARVPRPQDSLSSGAKFLDALSK